MGTSCSRLDKEQDPEPGPEKAAQKPPSKPHWKPVVKHRRGAKMASPEPKEALVIGHYEKHANTRLDGLKRNDALIYEKNHGTTQKQQGTWPTPREIEPEYFGDRDEIVSRGQQLAFDYTLTQSADAAERAAAKLIEIIRHNDDIVSYSLADPLTGYRGQKHRRFAGDHFLINWDLLNNTVLFKVARVMPKGAHLHIHFNSTLLPHVLLDIAEGMRQMYISSDKPLTNAENLDTCEIQFLMKSEKVAAADRVELRKVVAREASNRPDSELCNLFSAHYTQATDAKNQRLSWMKYENFRKEWDHISHEKPSLPQQLINTYSPIQLGHSTAIAGTTWKDWLISKLVFDTEESHNSLQTSEGTWEKFNGRTRMMKGLFNYETAFVKYTWQCLEEFERDNIQYAEIRPNFMTTNQIYYDDGRDQLRNVDTMAKIVQVFKDFKAARPNTSVCGLKVIYCTPRSFPPEKVQASLDECLAFKTGDFGDYIAGFDLVGEEAQGKPLKDFIPQFLDFKRKCRERAVEIPFLFHCGETLELGGDTDGNLIDALLLDSKRIGHGFALARKPYLIAEFKKRNICLEVCPISNQVLGLTPRMNGHAMYELLASDVHCTVNSDNGTLFKSTLSHDFYQVMVGSKAMNLHGWRQLIEWSIDHASMSPKELKDLRSVWEPRWDSFVKWINRSFKDVEPIMSRPHKPTAPGNDGKSNEAWQQYLQDEEKFQTQVQAWRDRVVGEPDY